MTSTNSNHVWPAVPEGGHVDAPRTLLPRPLRVALAVIIMFAAAFAPMVLALVPDLDARSTTWPDELVLAGMLGSYALTTLATVLLVWLTMRFVDRRPFTVTGIGWNAGSLPALGGGIAITVPVVVAVGVALESAGLLRGAPSPAPAGTPVWLVVVGWLGQAFLLQGIPEELLWRGYVLQTLRTRPTVAVWISAAVFGLCHLVSGGGQQNALEHILYLIMPFGFALLAGALVLRAGSVWAAVGVHGGFHTAAMIGHLAFGVGNGPALWVVAGAILGLMGVALLHGGRVVNNAASARPFGG